MTNKETTPPKNGLTGGQMTKHGKACSNFNSHKGMNLDSMDTPITTHTKDHTINLVLETYNCHGFSQTADYVLERLLKCDIIGLNETWLRQNELHSIRTAMQNHPKFKEIHNNFLIFSKSGMVDVESDHLGRP